MTVISQTCAWTIYITFHNSMLVNALLFGFHVVGVLAVAANCRVQRFV